MEERKPADVGEIIKKATEAGREIWFLFCFLFISFLSLSFNMWKSYESAYINSMNATSPYVYELIFFFWRQTSFIRSVYASHLCCAC